MARERMITRTIKSTSASVYVFDEQYGMSKDAYCISGEYTDKDEVLKILRKKYERADRKICAVDYLVYTEKLYGMSEETFMTYAEPLDAE